MIATREDMRRAAGRAIVCSVPGTGVTAEARELLREVRPAGVILLPPNIESPEQTAELCRELKSLRRDPLLICADQEGGEPRIRATDWPSLRDLGRHDDPALAERFGHAVGLELRALGVDVNFAPVLNVDTNPDTPVIGSRSLGSDPARVGELGAAIVRGLHAAEVAAVGKHFPGHGDTDVDSHRDLPRIGHELERWRTVEWPPFAAAARAGLTAVMTAHVVVEVLDELAPATLSAAALAPLRGELGFSGLLFSGGVEVSALAGYGPEPIAARALNATVDVLLARGRPELTLDLYRGVVVGCERQQISHDTLLGAEARLLHFRRRFWRAADSADISVLGCEEHQALARQIRNGSP